MASIQTNGISIEYEIDGSGEPLLLIMGLGEQMTTWPDQFVAEARGRRLPGDPLRQPRHRAQFRERLGSTVTGAHGGESYRPQNTEGRLRPRRHGHRRCRSPRRARHRRSPRRRGLDGRHDRPDHGDRPPGDGPLAHVDHVEHRRPHPRRGGPLAVAEARPARPNRQPRERGRTVGRGQRN